MTDVHETVKMYLTMYHVALVKFNSCQKLIPFMSASDAHWAHALHTQNTHPVNPFVMTQSAKSA